MKIFSKLSVAIIVVTILFSSNLAVAQDSEKIIVAYVTSGDRTPIDTKFFTHINYAFGYVNDSFDGIEIQNPDRLMMISGLKDSDKDLKVLLSIGGWGSGGFSEMARDEQLRHSFARDCARVIEQYRLDGVDLDWEYPTQSGADIGACEDDTENFTLLVQDIRREIGSGKLLTIASVASGKYVDFRASMPYMDFVNIMTYDMSRPPYHHAPLNPSDISGKGSCVESVEAHIAAGVPADKLVLGLPFYGRGNEDVGNFIGYTALLELDEYSQVWDEQAQAPYLANKAGKIVCSYDNPRSIAAKMEYIRSKGLLGAMYWQYGGDDEKGSLRGAVYDNLYR